MSRFNFTPLDLNGLVLVQRKSNHDERGFFSRFYCDEELRSIGWNNSIAQINHSFTRKSGTVRGMHFQYSPKQEMKLVSCLQGRVWDVAIDLRHSSKTYLMWRAEELSENNFRSLLIPEGFAHGFQTLTDNVVLIYCHSTHYDASYEGGLNPCDPKLEIKWPLKITEISTKDINQPFINDRIL